MNAGRDRLVLLGVKGGPAIHAKGPNPTSSLLVMDGQPIVVDCGLGVTRGVVEAGLPLTELRTIFITHLHSDHVLELGPLIHTAWTAGLDDPVTVYGPVGTTAVWRGFCQSLGYDIGLRVEDEGRPDLLEMVRVVEFGEGDLPVDGIEVAALRVAHPPVSECYALRFAVPGWSVVFSADTTKFPPLTPFSLNADILVHEAMLGPGVDALCAAIGNTDGRLRQHLMASHTLLDDVVEIARKASVGHLVLHHLVPCDLPGFGTAAWDMAARAAWPGGRVTVGRDGMEFLRKTVTAGPSHQPA